LHSASLSSVYRYRFLGIISTTRISCSPMKQRLLIETRNSISGYLVDICMGRL